MKNTKGSKRGRLFLAIFLSAISVFLLILDNDSKNEGLQSYRWTKDFSFVTVNAYLVLYFNKYDKFPDNADQIIDFINNELNNEVPFELIAGCRPENYTLLSLLSNEDGKRNISIVDVLDGTGGWYYDKKRKILVPNVLRPMKYYFTMLSLASYILPLKNEIPSQWEWPDELRNMDYVNQNWKTTVEVEILFSNDGEYMGLRKTNKSKL